ncbi:MAG: homocysteine S-methyltransferase family protein, partial [Oscillospiraceae bacterium]|nr:homocysteine S-methyltransferase family protein [Oscillospiraceae bacterium]
MNGPLFAFDRFTLLDGATGMNLIRAGMPAGVCPERWIAGAPEALTALQRRYAAAGSDAVYAPTFGANEVKLKKFGLADGLEALNARLVAVSRAAVGEGVAVGGDLSSPGVFLRPFGPLTFEELTAIFRRQAAALAAADVDFFAAETLMSLSEARAAVLAIRSVSDKPVLVTMTFGENGRTLSGETPAACLAAVQALGADAFGVNCSVGPDKVLAFMRPMAEIACVPLAAKPNAGTPRTAPDGSVYYDVTPESFAAHAADFAGIGVR